MDSLLLERAEFPDTLLEVLKTLNRAGHQAFLVGGGIRNILLELPVIDWDIATDGLPEQVGILFMKVIPTGVKHGTVTVLHGGDSFEVTTFRGDGAYLDGRHPDSVQYFKDIRDDLQRRDFTVNAMAYDPISGAFIDPHGGRRDLARRLLRTVGRADVRFIEDGLRPLRAIRFAATLNFTLEEDMRAAIVEAFPIFKGVSKERIREELLKLLEAKKPSIGLELLKETGYGAFIAPPLFHRNVSAFRICDEAPAKPETRLAVLAAGAQKDLELVKEALLRLRLSKAILNRVLLLTRHTRAIPEGAFNNRASQRLFLSLVGLEHWADLFDIREAELRAGGAGKEKLQLLEKNRRALELEIKGAPPLNISDLEINGDDICRLLSVPPGQTIGVVLKELLEWVIESPERNNFENLSQYVIKGFKGKAHKLSTAAEERE